MKTINFKKYNKKRFYTDEEMMRMMKSLTNAVESYDLGVVQP